MFRDPILFILQLPRRYSVSYSQAVMTKRERSRNSQNGKPPKSQKGGNKRAGSLMDRSIKWESPIALDETEEEREKRLAKRWAPSHYEPFRWLTTITIVSVT
jgi:hypothetical protein